jgi:hypothetical protein
VSGVHDTSFGFTAASADPCPDPAPRKQMTDSVERFLDLAATEEDHGEVGAALDPGGMDSG